MDTGEGKAPGVEKASPQTGGPEVKRTLVERVADVLWTVSDHGMPVWVYLPQARRVIAMVRRHDSRKGAKK